MTNTAIQSVQDAIVYAINAEPTVPYGPDATGSYTIPLLGNPRVYRDKAPSTAVLGYFIIGSASEAEGGFLNGQNGHGGTQRIHCWSTSTANAIRLYQWLKRLLDQKLILADHTVLSFGTRLMTTQSDPDGKAWQAIMDYTVESLEG